MRTIALLALLLPLGCQDAKPHKASAVTTPGPGQLAWARLQKALARPDWPAFVAEVSSELPAAARKGMAAAKESPQDDLVRALAKLEFVEERATPLYHYAIENRMVARLPHKASFAKWELKATDKGVIVLVESKRGTRHHVVFVEQDGKLFFDAFQLMFDMVRPVPAEATKITPQDYRGEHKNVRIWMHEGRPLDASCTQCGCRTFDVRTEERFHCPNCACTYAYDGKAQGDRGQPALRHLRVEENGDHALVQRTFSK